MTKKKSMNECIKTNDFEEAVSRYNATTVSWKKRWWNTIIEIYETCKDWSKKYVIDTVKQIVYKIKDTVKSFNLKKNWCYVIRIFKNGKWLFDKIGTTTQEPVKRWSQIISHGWKGVSADGLSYDVISLYDCNGIAPEGQESDFRSKLIKEYGNYIPNDRFKAKLEKEKLDAWATEYGSVVVQ